MSASRRGNERGQHIAFVKVNSGNDDFPRTCRIYLLTITPFVTDAACSGVLCNGVHSRNGRRADMKTSVAAILAFATLCCSATAASALASDPDPTGRVISVVEPEAAWGAAIDVSPDRNALYVVRSARRPDSSAAEQSQAELKIYDVSQPAAPQLVAVLPLGEIAVQTMAARGGRLFVLHKWNPAKQSSQLMIVDVSDASHPAIASDVPVDGPSLALSSDGRFARVSPLRPGDGVLLKIERSDDPQRSDEKRSDLEPISMDPDPQYRKQCGDFVCDRSGTRLLTLRSFGLQLWTLAPPAPPSPTVAVVLSSQLGEYKLLSEKAAAAVITGQEGIRIVSLKPRPFDAARLQKLHERLLADYALVRKQDSRIDAISLQAPYLWFATALEDGGVKDLIGDTKAGLITAVDRIAILNDYGFWLSHSSDPQRSVAALQKVVKIAPSRAVAQLNLGDAARLSLTHAGTWDEKTALAQIGLDAYAAYRQITGKEAPAAKDFTALYARPAGDDVCSYVAFFYNHGHQDDMWGYPDPVDIAGDGKLRHVYIFEQGTADVPEIIASTKELPSHDDQVMAAAGGDSEVEFYDNSVVEAANTNMAEPHVLPFKNGYYVVLELDGGPSAVVKPNAGPVCSFKRHFAAVLTANQAPAICEDARLGKPFEKLPTRPLASEIEVEDQSRLDFPSDKLRIDHDAEVELDPSAPPARLGFFSYNSGAGRGCDGDGMTVLRGNDVEVSARNDALIAAQRKMMNCLGSAAFLVQAGGETMIEIDGGRAVQRTVPPRMLLRLKDDKIETVCNVEQRQIYSPQPIAKKP
jgi:LVIVD repeat